MNTLQKLQQHLAAAPVEYRPGAYHKAITPHVVCKDGSTISVQASECHYSTPRSNIGPYTAVEVWCASVPVTEFPYDIDEPSAYVPIEDVVKFIDNHGGFNEDQTRTP